MTRAPAKDLTPSKRPQPGCALRVVGLQRCQGRSSRGAVLTALSEAGPKPATLQPELVRILTARLAEPARGQHISSALAQMSEIADGARGESDPALVLKNDEVFILDPFLLFYLRFGDLSMESEESAG